MKKQPSKSGAHILLIILILFSVNAFSQKLYLKAGLGYSLGMHKNYYELQSDYNHIFGDSTSSYSHYKLEKVSFGQGSNFELALGSYIGKYLSVEITGFYHVSNKQTIRYDEKNNYDLYYINFYSESILTGKSFGLKPSVMLWIGGDNFRPYFKLGGVIGFGSLKEETEFRVFNTHPNYYPTENITSVFEYQNSFNFGYTAGAGFEIILAKDIWFYSELNYSGFNVVPHSGKYTEYKYRGQDIMDNFTVSEMEYEYVDEYYSTDNESENSPTKQLKKPFSFSNVGIIAGLKFNIIH